MSNTLLFHATCQSEIDDIRSFGLNAPVVLAPNGVDIPDSYRSTSKDSSFTILSLGRVHPKKGLDRLVRAFASLESEFPS